MACLVENMVINCLSVIHSFLLASSSPPGRLLLLTPISFGIMLFTIIGNPSVLFDAPEELGGDNVAWEDEEFIHL